MSMFGWLRSRAGKLWLRDVAERSGWTFLEVFAAVFGMQGLTALASGSFPLGLAKGAALSAVAAALAVVKGAVAAKVKSGGLSPASAVSTPDPEAPLGTEPGWDEPAPADASVPPVPRSSSGAEPDAAADAPSWADPPSAENMARGLRAAGTTVKVDEVPIPPRRKRANTPAQNAARARRAAREAKKRPARKLAQVPRKR